MPLCIAFYPSLSLQPHGFQEFSTGFCGRSMTEDYRPPATLERVATQHFNRKNAQTQKFLCYIAIGGGSFYKK